MFYLQLRNFPIFFPPHSKNGSIYIVHKLLYTCHHVRLLLHEQLSATQLDHKAHQVIHHDGTNYATCDRSNEFLRHHQDQLLCVISLLSAIRQCLNASDTFYKFLRSSLLKKIIAEKSSIKQISVIVGKLKNPLVFSFSLCLSK